MSAPTPRMRMFAGPNGSGKSVLKSRLPQPLLGVYLNADEIEAGVRREGWLDARSFGVETFAGEILPFFTTADQLTGHGLEEAAKRLKFTEGRLDFKAVELREPRQLSYFASVAVAFLQQKLLEQKTSFTFETVMSHPSKVELLRQAQRLGYRTYLYFIATDDAEINVSRVENRVRLHGHYVKAELIRSRYPRTLGLLMDAIRHTNRAYIFDNSTDNPDHQHTWLAEITDGRDIVLKSTMIPAWFKRAVLDKIG